MYRKASVPAALLASILLYSCSERSPLSIDKPPLIKQFQPTATEFHALVGDTLRFVIDAYDPEDNVLRYRYLLGDSLVSTRRQWVYLVNDTGAVRVEGKVDDGLNETRVCWNLTREMPVDLPPKITYHSPEDLTPSIILGDSLEFVISAIDPEGKDVLYRFALDDEVVAYQRRFVFVSGRLGEVHVAGIASDGERASSVMWTVNVRAGPDSVPPAAVRITSAITGTDPGDVEVAWIAVGDDGMEGLPALYMARTSSVPITSEWAWDRATDRSGEPPPAAPGDTMRTVIRGLNPAHLVYVAVRARDEFNNLSPLGNSPAAWVKGLEVSGEVRNAVTGLGIDGIVVEIAGRSDTTDAGGGFYISELPLEETELQARDELDSLAVGEYYDLRSSYTVKHLDNLMLWLIPNQPFQDPCYTVNSYDTLYYQNFLHFFRIMADLEDFPFGNFVRRWVPPIEIWVPPGVYNGIDYESEMLEAIADWNTLIGMDLFNPTGNPPEIGVTVAYEDSGFHNGQEFYEVTRFDAQWFPLEARCTLYTTTETTLSP